MRRRLEGRILLVLAVLLLPGPPPRAGGYPITQATVIAPGGSCAAVGCVDGARYLCRDSISSATLWACSTSTQTYSIRVSAGGAPDCTSANVLCVGKHPGAEYSVICGATCSTTTSDCVAGSALKALKDAANWSPSNPYMVDIGPGLWQECVAINEIDDLTLHIGYGASIVPVVTTHTSIDGGVIRIANNTTGKVERLTIISEGYVRNDAFSSPEASVQVGPESCTGAALWDWVTIVGGTWVGHHDSVQWCGTSTTGNGITGLPHLFVKGATSIGGADNVIAKGSGDVIYQDATIRTVTNHCETKERNCVGGSNPGTTCPLGTECTGGGVCTFITAQRTGTVASGTSTTQFTLASTESNTNHIWGGRHVKLTAGTCNNGGAGHDCWIQDSDTNRLVTLQAACTPSVTPDNTCTYTIAAVPNASEQSDCGGMDWTQIRAQAGSTSWWKTSGVHAGISGQTTASDLDIIRLKNLSIDVQNNDWGPATSVGQAYVAGVLFPVSIVNHQNVIMDGLSVKTSLNTRLPTSASHAQRYGGVVFSDGDVEGTAVLTNSVIITENPGDPNAPNYGVSVKGSSALDMRVSNVHIETHNTVPSYVGATAQLHQASPANLKIGNVSSDTAITVSGSFSFMDTFFGVPCVTTMPACAAGSLGRVVCDADGTVGLCFCNGTTYVAFGGAADCT
jgi:hypothetical protein